MSELLSKLSRFSKISEEDILKAAQNSHRLYRTFPLKKRNGGSRLISEPSPTLKHIQKCIVPLVINDYPVSPFSAAYEKGNRICGTPKGI